MQKLNRHQMLKASLFLIPGVAVTFAAIRYLAHKPLDNAKPIAGGLSAWNHDVNGFWWISPSRALVIQSDTKSWNVLFVNPLTGDSSSVPPALAKNLMPHNTMPVEVIASPNGKWVLCNWIDVWSAMTAIKNRFSSQPKWSSALISLGENSRSIKQRDSYNSVWLRDSSGWIETNLQSDEFVLVSFSAERKTDRRTITQGGAGSMLGLTNDDEVLTDQHVPGSSGGSSRNRFEHRLVKVRLDSGALLYDGNNSGFVENPVQGGYSMPHLSPDGRRILWLTEVSNKDWRDRLPDRVGQLFGYRTGFRRWEMWLTDLSGGSKSFLGALVTQPRRDNPDSLEWSPDGTKFSYIRKHVVWIVALPQSS